MNGPRTCLHLPRLPAASDRAERTSSPSVPTTMASPKHHSRNGQTSSPPSSDPHDSFDSQQNHQRYYDGSSEDSYTHRDTCASDNGIHGHQDEECRYRDKSGYDPYRYIFPGPFAAQRYPMQRSLNVTHTDSDNYAYGQRNEPSHESLSATPRMGISASSTPIIIDFGSGAGDSTHIPHGPPNARFHYPRKKSRRSSPVSHLEVWFPEGFNKEHGGHFFPVGADLT